MADIRDARVKIMMADLGLAPACYVKRTDGDDCETQTVCGQELYGPAWTEDRDLVTCPACLAAMGVEG